MEMRNNRNLNNKVIHPKLFNILSNACKKRDNIRPYFKILIDLMNKNNIYYTVDFGLLLGTVRDKSEILWDDDYDIFMFRQDVSELVQLLKKGQEYKVDLTTFRFGIIQNDQGFLNIIAIDTVAQKKIDGITIDLFFEGDKSGWAHPAFNNMFPLRKVKCGELTVNIMNNPHPHLTNVFGNNYMNVYVICNKEINKYGYSKNHENRYKKISKETYIKLKTMYYNQLDNDDWETNTVSSVSDIGTQTCNSPLMLDDDKKEFVIQNENIRIEINDTKIDEKNENPTNKEIVKPISKKVIDTEKNEPVQAEDSLAEEPQAEQEEPQEEQEEPQEEQEEPQEEQEQAEQVQEEQEKPQAEEQSQEEQAEQVQAEQEQAEQEQEEPQEEEEQAEQVQAEQEQAEQVQAEQEQAEQVQAEQEQSEEEQAEQEQEEPQEEQEEPQKEEQPQEEEQVQAEEQLQKEEQPQKEEEEVNTKKDIVKENPVSVKISLDEDSIEEEQIVSIDIKSIDDKNELPTKEDLKLELKEELKLELKQELKQELKKKRSEVKNNDKKEEIKTNNIMESFSKNRKGKVMNLKNEFDKKGKKFKRNGNKILLN